MAFSMLIASLTRFTQNEFVEACAEARFCTRRLSPTCARLLALSTSVGGLFKPAQCRATRADERRVRPDAADNDRGICTTSQKRFPNQEWKIPHAHLQALGTQCLAMFE